MAETVTAGTEVPHDAGHKKEFPPLNPDNFAPQLIWLALTFVVLFVALWRVVLPRIGEVIEERRDRIKRDLDAAERLKGETEKALAMYEKALGDARSNASGIARQTRESLNAEVDKERSVVEKELAAKLGAAEARIAGTKAKALASVTEIAGDTVSSIVNKLIGQDVSRDEIERALASAPGQTRGK
jgi:F-type H+-transporting ATPase subunit b